MEYLFEGYIKNEAIRVGMLMPYFKCGDGYCFQELSEDNKTITEFEKINEAVYAKNKHDFVPIEKPQKVVIGQKSIGVIKNITDLYYGTYAEIVDELKERSKSGIEINKIITNIMRDVYDINDFLPSKTRINPIIETDEAVATRLPSKRSTAGRRKEVVAIGRRKEAVARVYLNRGTGNIIINGKEYKNYFPLLYLQNQVELPLKAINKIRAFDLIIDVQGGGPKGQAEAIKMSIARVLVESNPDYRAALRKEGLIKTRTTRLVKSSRTPKRQSLFGKASRFK